MRKKVVLARLCLLRTAEAPSSSYRLRPMDYLYPTRTRSTASLPGRTSALSSPIVYALRSSRTVLLKKLPSAPLLPLLSPTLSMRTRHTTFRGHDVVKVVSFNLNRIIDLNYDLIPEVHNSTS